ncbi:hypothetical protein S245_060357, partial [Arachis hypogaea]
CYKSFNTRATWSWWFTTSIHQVTHQITQSSLPDEAVYDKEKSRVSWPKQLNASLEVVDPEIVDIIELEKARQWK